MGDLLRLSTQHQNGELSPSESSGQYPFTRKALAALTKHSEAQVSAYVKSGLLAPVRNTKGAYRFHFQDAVLLRTAKRLSKNVSQLRLHRALKTVATTTNYGVPTCVQYGRKQNRHKNVEFHQMHPPNGMDKSAFVIIY